MIYIVFLNETRRRKRKNTMMKPAVKLKQHTQVIWVHKTLFMLVISKVLVASINKRLLIPTVK